MKSALKIYSALNAAFLDTEVDLENPNSAYDLVEAMLEYIEVIPEEVDMDVEADESIDEIYVIKRDLTEGEELRIHIGYSPLLGDKGKIPLNVHPDDYYRKCDTFEYGGRAHRTLGNVTIGELHITTTVSVAMSDLKRMDFSTLAQVNLNRLTEIVPTATDLLRGFITESEDSYFTVQLTTTPLDYVLTIRTDIQKVACFFLSVHEDRPSTGVVALSLVSDEYLDCDDGVEYWEITVTKTQLEDRLAIANQATKEQS